MDTESEVESPMRLPKVSFTVGIVTGTSFVCGSDSGTENDAASPPTPYKTQKFIIFDAAPGLRVRNTDSVGHIQLL
jgi:hypothetical protein